MDDERKTLLPEATDPAGRKAGPPPHDTADLLKGKAGEAFESAKATTAKWVDTAKLHKRVYDLKAELAGRFEALGKAAYLFLRNRETPAILASQVAEIDALAARIARKAEEEKEMADHPPRESFFDRLKQKVADTAGAVKVTVERSLIQRDLAAAERSLGEMLYRHRAEFAAALEAFEHLAFHESAIAITERELDAIEKELAKRGGAA